MAMRLDEIQAGRGGIFGAVARLGLSGLSLAWRGAWYLRRGTYAVGLRIPSELPVPVISVGNVAVGGTGKTPFTAWLVEGLKARGRKPGILSRGYGPEAADGSHLSDEGAVLRQVLGEDVPQVEMPSRRRGGKRLLADHPATDAVVLDDGFQHWALARDLDIVLLDATNPFGYGRLLPRGRLREPVASLARAGVVVLTRTERRTEEEIAEILGDVARRTGAPVACFRTVPVGVQVGGATRTASWLRKKMVFAACGIGNPAAYEAFLTDLGATVVGRQFLADHAPVDAKALDGILDAAREAGAEWTVLTRKDAVKLPPPPEDVVVLDVAFEAVSGEAALWEKVEEALARREPVTV